jgi:MoaA/NifB/PqqE/SkfB family radical SAM enzyme
VRLGAELPHVLENLDAFRHARPASHRPTPEIGIVFVAMQRNIADLPEVINIGQRLGATRFMVTNVMPYTPDLTDETLYDRTLRDITYLQSRWLPTLTLPRMELNNLTREPFFQALNSGCNVSFAGNNLGSASDTCSFIESGSISVGWDGNVSPCLPLLHTHATHFRGHQRISHRHVVGNVQERSLLELWNDPAYVAHRERVQNFAFSPCASCGGCEMSQTNETDCSENGFPTCGGCLWAQGVIQCP